MREIPTKYFHRFTFIEVIHLWLACIIRMFDAHLLVFSFSAYLVL